MGVAADIVHLEGVLFLKETAFGKPESGAFCSTKMRVSAQSGFKHSKAAKV